MHTQLPYQMSNYKGNQAGHDNSLRADSQQPTNYVAGQQVMSQYRGIQSTYQPANLTQFSPSQSMQNQQYQNQMAQSHMASQSHFQAKPQFKSQYQNQMNQSQYGQSQFAKSQYQPMQSMFASPSQQQSQYQPHGFAQPSAQSHHMANYKGNQPNHDQHLRSDSFS